MKLLKKDRPPSSKVVAFAGLFITIVLTAIPAGRVTIDQRIIIFRYWSLCISGFMAFIIPHVLFPDSNFSAIQLVNFSPGQIISYQLRNLRMPLITIVLSYGIISFYDPRNWLSGVDVKVTIFINGLLFLTGIFAISYYSYSKVGIESQAWQEGIKGDKIRKFQRETGSVQVPIGTIPTFNTTIIITVTGMASIVLGSYLGAIFHIRMDWLPGVLLLGGGAYLIQRDIPVFDRFFYQTHAFYSDLFFSSSPSLESSRTASYSNIYWVPSHWRPSAWAGIVQFDRYFPMGRVIFLGHFVLWLLFLFGASPLIRESYLFLFVLMQNSSIYMLLNPRLGPVSWNYRMQGITNWIITRFFIQIRWILPFILSLLLIATLSNAFSFAEVLFWGLGYAVTTLTVSSVLTLFHEFKFSSQYA